MNKAKDHIKNYLLGLANKFSTAGFLYEYEPHAKLHIIEVMPEHIFSSAEFRNDLSGFSIDFDRLFFPESVLFVSESSLNHVEHPEFSIEGPLFNVDFLSRENVQGDFKFSKDVENHYEYVCFAMAA